MPGEPYRYEFNHETNQGRIILANNFPAKGIPICKSCSKEFSEGDTAYMPDIERHYLYCRDCLLQGTVKYRDAKVTSDRDKKNNVYYKGKMTR